MLSFLASTLASILANLISSALNQEKRTSAKDAFEERSRVFHNEISPYLLKEVLPKFSPQLSDKLEKITINGRLHRLPYISLLDGEMIKLSKNLTTEIPDTVKDSKLIDWLKYKLGKRIENNPTFSLQSISSNGELTIGMSDYVSTLSTSDAHYFNLIRYFPLSKKSWFFFSYRNNKYTTKWLKSLKKVGLENSFRHYHASVGCSVLTVIPNSDGDYKYLIKNNSKKKGSSVSDKHVIPSFMMQPVSRVAIEQEKELDFEINILREFGEELLDVSELENMATYDALKLFIDDDKILNNLQNGIKNGDVVLMPTGLCLDIFRLRPEVTFLLIIKDKDVYARLKTNWEAEGSFDPLDLNDEEAYNKLITDENYPLCSPGLAALINGRGKAVTLINHSSSKTYH